jgi:hypothetical protein
MTGDSEVIHVDERPSIRKVLLHIPRRLPRAREADYVAMRRLNIHESVNTLAGTDLSIDECIGDFAFLESEVMGQWLYRSTGKLEIRARLAAYQNGSARA